MYKIFNTKLPNNYYTAKTMKEADEIAKHFIIGFREWEDKDERVFIFKGYKCLYEYQGNQEVMLKSKDPQTHYDKDWYAYKVIENYKKIIKIINGDYTGDQPAGIIPNKRIQKR